ncbi:Transcription factor AP-4 [Orchesella cincta]|uniref:Transcription factor AP-4 n=1 Tax=Orchesella cincta TaxID=48709 RepID=A0A1D2MDU8_ORCCI|nr:Transcription factor AP-4 [Orchesella cincta]
MAKKTITRWIRYHSHPATRKKLKRLDDTRRLVANSNERRRMQGINNGFEALRGFLHCGDEQKLSKAAILQKTVTYIQQILNEKSDLIMRNAQLEKMVTGGKVEETPVFCPARGQEVFVVSTTTDHAVPIIKQEPLTERRRKRKASTAQLENVDDEGVASLYSSEHSGSWRGLCNQRKRYIALDQVQPIR